MLGRSLPRVSPRFLPLLLAVVGAWSLPAAGLAQLRCDSSTALTLVGLDTSARSALLAPPPADGKAWLVELDLAGEKATAWPDDSPSGHFGGSTGPGPVIAASRCGERCLQPVVFRRGRWEPLGEPLLVSATMTFHATWDREGSPWVLLHSLAGDSGVAAKAYRLAGGDWESAGGVSIRGVGSPGVYPAPPGERGVVSGDAVFVADAPPRRWLDALPAAPAAEPGELVWAGGREALHIGADGALRWTADAGRSWQDLRWLPFSGGEGDLAWRVGREYRIELPDGERSSPPAAIWNDLRVPTRPRLYLAERPPGGAWRQLAETPHGLLTEGGERLPYNHLFRFAADHWALVTGCVGRREGGAIALRALRGRELRPPALIPIEPASRP